MAQGRGNTSVWTSRPEVLFSKNICSLIFYIDLLVKELNVCYDVMFYFLSTVVGAKETDQFHTVGQICLAKFLGIGFFLQLIEFSRSLKVTSMETDWYNYA